MTDYIKRADAIDACCRGWNNTAEDCIRNIKALPSAETHEIRTETHGVCLISKDDAMGAVQDHFNANGFKGYDDGQKMMDRIKALPSAEAVCEDTQTAKKRLQWDCTANFVAEQLDRLRNMTDEERWEFFIKFFSPSADDVIIHEDGTLEVKVPNAKKVGRVLVMDTDSHIGGGLFYQEDGEE